MGKQMTEMLKGTLEGIVLALLAGQPAYGYEITARLREQGFTDIVEGTVYALLVRIEQRGLVDVEKVPSEKGPPRKVYSLNARGRAQLEEFWRTWSFLAGTHRTAPHERKERTDMVAKWIETLTGSLEQKKQYKQVQGPHRGPPRAATAAAAKAFERYFMYYGGRHRRRHPRSRCSATSPTCGSAPPPTARRCATSSATTRSSSPRPSPQAYAGTQWIDKERARLDRGDRGRGREEERNDHRRRPPSGSRASRSRSRTCTCCAASTSRSSAGSIFALLGSNGAGKTTVVRILSTLLQGGCRQRDGPRLRRRRASPATCGSRSA